jgi:hypothetical protein
VSASKKVWRESRSQNEMPGTERYRARPCLPSTSGCKLIEGRQRTRGMGAAVSYLVRAGAGVLTVLVCVLAICCGGARAQIPALQPLIRPPPPESDLLARAKYFADELDYYHDDEDDAAPDYVYCEGVRLWKRLKEETFENPNIFTVAVALEVMDYLNDELGEDEFIEEVVYDDYAYCGPPHLAEFFGGFEGAYFGTNVVWDRGTSRITERFADSGMFSNAFTNSSGSPGGGIRIGYNFAPAPGGFATGVFLDADALSENIYQTFPGGGYLGTTIDFDGTAGVKAGFIVAPSFLPKPVWLYGIGGVSVKDETLKIYLGGPVSTSNQIVVGGTVGFGAEFQPVTEAPLTIRTEYRHTFWDDAKFNTPSASPAFNYGYRDGSDSYLIGMDYRFH